MVDEHPRPLCASLRLGAFACEPEQDLTPRRDGAARGGGVGSDPVARVPRIALRFAHREPVAGVAPWREIPTSDMGQRRCDWLATLLRISREEAKRRRSAKSPSRRFAPLFLCVRPARESHATTQRHRDWRRPGEHPRVFGRPNDRARGGWIVRQAEQCRSPSTPGVALRVAHRDPVAGVAPWREIPTSDAGQRRSSGLATLLRISREEAKRRRSAKSPSRRFAPLFLCVRPARGSHATTQRRNDIVTATARRASTGVRQAEQSGPWRVDCSPDRTVRLTLNTPCCLEGRAPRPRSGRSAVARDPNQRPGAETQLRARTLPGSHDKARRREGPQSGRRVPSCSCDYRRVCTKGERPRTLGSTLSGVPVWGNARCSQSSRGHRRHVTPMGTMRAGWARSTPWL